jgi:basic membrane protein A and related proteins
MHSLSYWKKDDKIEPINPGAFDMPLNIGQVLNQRYQIVRLLGQGGFGAVYQAWDLNLKVPCAVKENFETSPSAMRQFEREASMLAALRHPNLPRVTDHFIIPGQGQYLVMDYIEGEDLQAILERDGKALSESQVVSWLVEICDALNYLHTQPVPVIHRDIKPANIKITPDGRALLVDFGIAKAFNPESRTTLGARAFTPGYSPFEQYGQAPTDARSDIYALGATAFGVLTGQAPTESIARMAGTPLPQPRQLNPAISPQTEKAILKALEIMPDKRFQSILEFKQALTESPRVEQTFLVSPVSSKATVQTLPATQVAPAPEAISAQPGKPKTGPTPKAASPIKLVGIGAGIGGLVLVVLVALAGLAYALGFIPGAATVTPTHTPPVPLVIAPTNAPPTRAVEKPAETRPPEPAFKACLVTDSSGIDDQSFNAAAWKGIEDAQREFGIQGLFRPSPQQSDVENNINGFIVDEKCNLIITAGFLLGDATRFAAERHPDQKFSIADFAMEPAMPNVANQVFDTAQASFLAGYLAAGVTHSGKVGTYGGVQIPPVVAFMDGFVLGVQQYNRVHGKDVQVSGWDPATQTGLFTGNFESVDDGRMMAQRLIDEGADVILPVAGGVGLGTAMVAKEHGGVYIIGVDTDWYLTAPDFRPVILTSVIKRIDVLTFNVIRATLEGGFHGGEVMGNLENDGVGLAPFHDLESLVPPALKAELEEERAQILNGTLKTRP